jgi:hypothetical protein
MLGATHLIVGAAIQKGTKHWWLYAPLALASHGVLDASVIYHDFTDWRLMLVAIVTSPIVAWYCVKKRLWVGALLAVIPDVEHIIPGIFHTPGRLHHWIQLYPAWNYLGLYGQPWGILVELAIITVLVRRIRKS